jgi:K+-sensing histidine kinase KdpD
LKKVNKHQTELLHFVGHEVKGYLTKARAIFSVLLEGDLGALSDEARPLINRALEEMTKGVGSVTDILRAASLNKGKIIFKMESFSLMETSLVLVD